MVERIRLRVHSSKRRRLVVFVTALLLFTVVSCVFFLNKDEFLEKGLAFLEAPVSGDVNPVRGAIYDRNYKEMAVSLDRVSVYARIREVVNHRKVASHLAPVLGKSEEELLRLFKTDSLRVWLAKNIDQQQEDAVQEMAIPGIFLYREVERFYPQRERAGHVVGFVEDDIGLSGVEYHFNRLINEYGIIRGAETEKVAVERSPGEDAGHYLVLTLDLKIQEILEDYLASLVKGHSGRKGSVFLMDVMTGAVVGAASSPFFDPNRFHDYSKEQLVNNLTEPLSIPLAFRKVLWEAALLQAQFEESDVMLPWSLVPPTPSLGSQVRLWEKLQLDDELDVDFIVRKKNQNRMTTIYSSSVPDLETVPESSTPLHLLTAFSRLVNGGRKIVPHVVDRLRNKWGEEVLPEGSWMEKVEEGVVDKEVSREVARVLAAQMEGGSLFSGFLEGRAIYLKNHNGLQHMGVNHLLVSTIPAKEPKLIMLVALIDSENGPEYAKNKKPQKQRKRSAGKHFSGRVEAEKLLLPPAKKIISSLVLRQEVMKDLSDILEVENKGDENYPEELSRKQKKIVKEQDELGSRLRTMPDLRGYSLRKSLRILQDYQLDIKIEGTGVVVSQTPSPGAVMGSTKQCTIILERKDPVGGIKGE